MSEYPPLEAYGLVGNLETCALVSVDGSVDWCPLPHLESPSVFARLLDAERGGRFGVRPAAAYESTQRYLDRTNVLRTEFRTAMGDLAVTDFMPIVEDGGERIRPPTMCRRVTCERGRTEVEVAFEPRFDYARAETTVEARDDGLLAAGGEESAFLTTDRPFDVSDGEATATVTLTEGDAEWFVLRYGDAEPVADGTAGRLLDDTVSFWRGWAHSCTESECVFGGPWHDQVVRSGLVLKLLTHRETGAIAAAPTTSLPEDVGGVRNWDYRYNWIRDAAFTIQALSNLHHGAEARSYFEWFLDRCRAEDPERIQPLYGLHGDPDLEERELEHLSGYRGSSPVRVGNGAIHQRQLDIYGELVLAVYETVSDDGTLDRDDWDAVRAIVDYVPEVWREPDAGIWEVRGGPRHFVFSKLMCWVALDRGIAIAEEHGFDAPLDRWRAVRNEIREAVLERGYSEERGAFVRAFDDDALDATALLVPFVGFLPFDDERVQRTVEAIRTGLTTEEGLVRRYDGDDGLPGEEGTFVLCSFWLVDALALSGRVEEAREVFLGVLDYANPLGLLAEVIDEDGGVQVGNYPQAFSHVGLVNSALYLGRAAGRTGAGIEPMGLELGRGTGASEE